MLLWSARVRTSKGLLHLLRRSAVLLSTLPQNILTLDFSEIDFCKIAVDLQFQAFQRLRAFAPLALCHLLDSASCLAPMHLKSVRLAGFAADETESTGPAPAFLWQEQKGRGRALSRSFRRKCAVCDDHDRTKFAGIHARMTLISL